MKIGPLISKDRFRLVVVSLFLFSFFCFLILQFYKVQILEGKKWSRQANLQHQLVVSTPFKRGVFYSNIEIKEKHPQVEQPFVIDIPKFHLFIDPFVIPEKHRDIISQNISNYLDVDDKRARYIRREFERKSRSRKIAAFIDHKMKENLQDWWSPFAKKNKLPSNALYYIQDYKRSYPFGDHLGAVLHTLRDDRDEKTHQGVPTGGLEMYFNDKLKGKEGKKLLYRSPRHALEAGKEIIAPENGADVYLTINHYLQAIAEEEIEKGVKIANAKCGWAVMMDPKTGDVVALAQYPRFNPENYRKYYNDPNLLQLTRVKAINDCYEVGSTMKPITVAIALLANEELKKRGEKPLFDPKEKVRCDDGHFPGRTRPIKDIGVHRYLNLDMAIQKSSNIYVAKLAQKIVERCGAAWYREQLQNIFGFGEKTGIELPSETRGLLPTPGKVYPCGRLEWSTPTPFSLAMGYNILANSMQVLRAWSVIANGGYKIKPTLIKKIVNKDEISYGTVEHEKVLDEKICNRVVKAIKFVTKKGGTSHWGDIYGHTEAGKSSSAEKVIDGAYSKHQHVSSFMGFAPAENPQFILIVSMDNPEYRYLPGIGKTHYGGKSAGPVFCEIMRRSLEYLGTPPDDPHGYPRGDPRRIPEKADYFHETEKLNALYKKWNS